MLKIKWTDKIMNEEVFQKVIEERLLLKILNNRWHSWIGHIIRYNEFVINILEGAISGKKGHGKTLTTILTASRQEHRSGQLYNNEKNSVQQSQMESCQPIRRRRKRRRKMRRRRKRKRGRRRRMRRRRKRTRRRRRGRRRRKEEAEEGKEETEGEEGKETEDQCPTLQCQMVTRVMDTELKRMCREAMAV
jgi:hypothetical protein